MYNNIGKKLKILAIIAFIAGGNLSIFASFYMFLSYGESLILPMIFCLLLGPIASWIASLPLYGFGELIDKVCEIEKNTRVGIQKAEPQQEQIEAFKDTLKEEAKTAEAEKMPKDTEQKARKEALKTATSHVSEADFENSQYIEFKCPNCNELLAVRSGDSISSCPYCGVEIK